MIELTGGKFGIHATPFRNGRALKPVRLPSGSIVETPTAEHERHIPKAIPNFFEVDADGNPVSLSDLVSGTTFLASKGAFLLPDGRPAAVYGCSAEEISAPSR